MKKNRGGTQFKNKNWQWQKTKTIPPHTVLSLAIVVVWNLLLPATIHLKNFLLFLSLHSCLAIPWLLHECRKINAFSSDILSSKGNAFLFFVCGLKDWYTHPWQKCSNKLVLWAAREALQNFLRLQVTPEGKGRTVNLLICTAGILQLLAVVWSDTPHSGGHR